MNKENQRLHQFSKLSKGGVKKQAILSLTAEYWPGKKLGNLCSQKSSSTPVCHWGEIVHVARNMEIYSLNPPKSMETHSSNASVETELLSGYSNCSCINKNFPQFSYCTFLLWKMQSLITVIVWVPFRVSFIEVPLAGQVSPHWTWRDIGVGHWEMKDVTHMSFMCKTHLQKWGKDFHKSKHG